MVVNYFKCIGQKNLIEALNKDGSNCEHITEEVATNYCESFCFGDGCSDYDWDTKSCNLSKSNRIL